MTNRPALVYVVGMVILASVLVAIVATWSALGLPS
jgi:hypothetical protein